MAKRKVLVTGASGYIAGLLLPALRDSYELTLVDVRDTDGNGNPIDDVELADLTQRDRDKYRKLFQGIDAVVHCGFARAEDNANPDQRFAAEFMNVQMAYNVYQTSLEEGISRVVVASSNHAADYYEPLILQHKMDLVTPSMRAFSDNYYGWSKEVYEHLGFVFAAGKLGDHSGYGQNLFGGPGDAGQQQSIYDRQLENVQVRIGAPRETDIDNCTLGDMTRVRRALAAYISQRDLSQLFIKSIETKDIRNEFSVPFQVFYGISGNSHAFWSITNARRIINYTPEDNSELRFADKVAKHLAAAQSAGEDEPSG